jgi:hypothetical protein
MVWLGKNFMLKASMRELGVIFCVQIKLVLALCLAISLSVAFSMETISFLSLA